MAAHTIDTLKLVEVCRANDAAMVGIFGSFARGEATEESDVDVLIRFRRPKSLVAIVRLQRELSAILGRKIDLVTEASLSPFLRPGITHDLQVLYEGG
jgi:hypothetical protein